MNYRSIFENNFNIKKVRWNESQGIGLCPLHDDTNPSFSINKDNGLWKCFSGCGSGNLYQLAERLNMSNKHEYIKIQHGLHSSNVIKAINGIKKHSEGIDEIKIRRKYEMLKNLYGERVNLGDNYKNKYVGKDDKGNTVFIYPNGIKIHKKYWIKKVSIDSSNQIFMIDELMHFDKNKPLHIFEGEKDALASPLQGISFSSGCQSIPKDISALYKFDDIVILYDNDIYGKEGSKTLAERIKSESPNTMVKIAQWESSLPKGYDVYDDGKETKFEKLNEAIINAVVYEITTPIKLEGFTVMTGKKRAIPPLKKQSGL